MSRSFEVCANQYKEYLNILHEMLNEQHVRDPRTSERYQSALHGAKQTASELNALVGVTSGVALLPQEAGPKSSFCIVRRKNGSRDPLTSASSSLAAPGGDTEEEEDGKDGDHFLSGVIVKFPSASGVWTNCPFEVFFDEREWLPCVILEVSSTTGCGGESQRSGGGSAALGYMHGSDNPFTRSDGEEEEFPFLWRYTVGIIGYNAILENIVALYLRRFDAASHVPIDFQRRSALENRERNQTAPSSSLLTPVSESSSMQAHAVHPSRNRFEPCCVERLTLRQTGFVTFESQKGNEEAQTAPKESALTAGEEEGRGTLVELPISHIHLGRVYPVLRKVRQISAGERRERKVAAIKRKKERAVLDKKTQMTQVINGAATWKSILQDVAMPSSGTSSGSKKTSNAGYIKKYR